MNHVALHTIEICAGVGMLGEGLRAGLAYLGIQTRAVCFVEREAYPASVLAARMEEGSLDAAPVWPDLLTFDARRWAGAVDGIVAGFPCQDLSLAGRRAGLDGKRSGLFFDILDIADGSGAWFLFLENVAGIASATASVVDEAEGALEERAAARVLGELAERGWHAEWLTLSASDVGASHGRERWFCFAWRPMVDAECPERGSVGSTGAGGQQGHDGGRAEADRGAGEPVEVLGNAQCTRRQTPRCGHAQYTRCKFESGCRTVADTSSPGCQGRELGRALHGNRGGRKHMDQLSNFVAHSSHLAQPIPRGETSSPADHGSPQPSASKNSTTPRLLSRRLNPMFTENLMGWPLDWTSTHERSASSAAETELWRSALQQRLSSFFGEQEFVDMDSSDYQERRAAA